MENGYEFAVFGELKKILDDEKICVSSSVNIYEKLSPLSDYVDWPNNLIVRKNMQKYLYEILSKNNFPDEKIDELTKEIITLTVRHLYER